ncbi:amino acid/polyamine transporter I [Fusarium oxysporum]|nr:amino acid/polyamine transporter I [Fusarium oxysporum]
MPSKKSRNTANMSNDDDKRSLDVHDAPIGINDNVDEKKATAADRADMYRMGKTQEITRNFRFFVSTIGLVNGGTAGTIWMFFVCWMGFLFVNTSMAEMASMAPTTGGQYHWVSEFAPSQYQKPISYLMGWMCVLGWQTSCASSAFITGTQIQGLIVLNNPNYVPKPWHGTLLTIAIAAFSVLFNIYVARKLPLIEAIVLVIHFSDGGGWNSIGGSTLVGILAGVLPLLGADAAVHMSEELHDASRTLPRSMIMTTLFNGGFGWIMVITYCFCIGNLEEVITSPTGQPFMQVFYNSTQSVSSATAMASVIVVMIAFSNLTMVSTSSRQLFAFARDQAIPFSAWFSDVPAGWDAPINAILVTFLISSLLSLINIGSAVALNSITSLATTGLLSSYMVSIGCMIWRRCTKSPLLPSKFSLGRWGLAINIISEAFLVLIFVLAFMPGNPNPTASQMNWSILIYGTVALSSLVYYVFRGTHRYEGPVAYVRMLVQ